MMGEQVDVAGSGCVSNGGTSGCQCLGDNVNAVPQMYITGGDCSCSHWWLCQQLHIAMGECRWQWLCWHCGI